MQIYGFNICMLSVYIHQEVWSIVELLYGTHNRSFRYLLPYHDNIGLYARYLLVGCFFLRKDLEVDPLSVRVLVSASDPLIIGHFALYLGNGLGVVGHMAESKIRFKTIYQ